MFTVDSSIFITRPQREVFAFVSNAANAPRWQGAIESIQWTSEGPVGAGSTQHSVARFLGRNMDSTVEITSWDPPNRYSWRVVSGPLPVEGTLIFDAREDGTQFTMRGNIEPGGLFRLAGGLFKRQLSKQQDADLITLKHLLENGSASPSGHLWASPAETVGTQRSVGTCVLVRSRWFAGSSIAMAGAPESRQCAAATRARCPLANSLC